MKKKYEKRQDYFISREDWNNGKEYLIKLEPSKADRLSCLGYKVTKIHKENIEK